MRPLVALTLVVGATACAKPAPPVVEIAPPPVVERPAPSFEQKQSWIMRLEDQRILRDAVATPESSDSSIVTPDLVALLTDGDARIRRRAALAVGRVGLPDGVMPLTALLNDEEAEVRQMAAFSLGLLADPRARAALVAALNDPAPIVQGSAAEALGLLGEVASAEAVAQMVARLVEGGINTEQEIDARRDSRAAAARLGLVALGRLKTYSALATAVLDARGQPRLSWWPVAFALQRTEDPRALNALMTLANDPHPYTRALAVKGLGALKDRSAIPVVAGFVTGSEQIVAVEAIRALGRIGDPAVGPNLLDVIFAPKPNPTLRLEAIAALGSVGGDEAWDGLVDLLPNRDPRVRAAAIRALAALHPTNFITVLSGYDADSDWSVRAALASTLGTLPTDAGLTRLRLLLQDKDQRVVPPALASVVQLAPPDAVAIMTEKLKADDVAVRAAAARGLGELKPENGLATLTTAFEAAKIDTDYLARAAALTGAANYGAAAVPLLTSALEDKEWAVRVRAATLLKQINAATDASLRIRPVPSVSPERAALYSLPRIVAPPVSTQAYIDTDRGTVQIELAVIDAPLTVENFVTLARRGFYDGLPVHRVVPDFVIQTGDPRGDSEGGPGYTIRDELNQRPYLRGTVGMALDWADTGGSQFFITHSPQPQLDARYTVFGRVVSGMEVVDQIEQGDVIRKIRIWDGSETTTGP